MSTSTKKTTPHLVQRGTTWHTRIDVPADVRAAFGNRRILSKSLKTGNKILAKELAAVQIGKWKAEFRAIRDLKLTQADEWREKLIEGVVKNESIKTNAIMSIVNEIPHIQNESLVGLSKNELTARIVAHIKALEGAGAHEFAAKTVALMSKKNLSPIEFTKESFKLLKEANVNITAKKYKLSSNEIDEATILATNPSTYKPKSPISTVSIKKFENYLITQSGNIRTRGVCMSKLEAFSAHLTSEGLNLTFDTVADYLDTISSNRQTRQGYLWALNKFWKWAIKYDKYFRDQFKDKPNPFDGHEHARTGKDSGGSWIPYSKKEVEQLYAASQTKGDKDLTDLIKFACYTGCRIEEIGRISDNTTIFNNSGLPVGFKVDDSKTAAGIREIPIHSRLLALYKARLANCSKNNGYLFAGGRSKTGMRLNGPGQRFSALKKVEGFSSQHTFHSLRKTFTSELHKSGVGMEILPFLIGHITGAITLDLYSSGPSFKQKKSAIEKIKFNF